MEKISGKINDQIEAVLFGTQFKQMMDDQIKEIRKKYDLCKVDIILLYYLSQSGEKNTSKDVAERLRLNKGHVSQAVNRMRKRGVINLVTNEDDRRYVHLELTKESGEMVKEINRLWTDMYEIVFEGVSREEEEALKRICTKIGRNMENALQKK